MVSPFLSFIPLRYMQNLTRFFIVTAIFSGIAVFISCSNNTGSDGEADFDREGMLENYGNNIIIPAYEAFQESVNNLDASATAFSEAPTAENLQTLQDDLKQARLAWQDASIFQFGPAEMQVLRTYVNTYPTDTEQIQSNIESGDYSLGTIDNQDAAGFPALGYLLHGVGETDEETITQYTTDPDAENRRQYLLDNVSFIKENIDSVVEEWSPNGGDYLGTFLSEDNAGTDVGSSIGMLVNALVLHYERFLRDGKIGIPSGVRSAGVPRPSATEAYYGGYSVELAVANMEASKRLFLGNGLDGSEGPGLQENLQALGAGDLSTQITTKFDESLTELGNLSDPLSEQIENDNESVTNTFQKLQETIALLKADMTSVLGVTITYQDNDGD